MSRFSCLSTGLNHPVLSPRYLTKELAARENMTTFRILMSFSGAIWRNSDPILQARKSSVSWLSHHLLCCSYYELCFLRSAKNRLIKWNTTLKAPHPIPSFSTGLISLMALIMFSLFMSRWMANRIRNAYLTTFPAFLPSALKNLIASYP